ncbi:MAG: hypothetical protein LBQ31_04080 [Bacteroidales bacterium]|jgi:hypothetical protein|nr:hypothetical protein [Bacteroidales bacterium]
MKKNLVLIACGALMISCIALLSLSCSKLSGKAAAKEYCKCLKDAGLNEEKLLKCEQKTEADIQGQSYTWLIEYTTEFANCDYNPYEYSE